MLKTIKSRLVFYRFIISYFLVFLCPLVILGVILHNTSAVNLQKEVEMSNLYKLTQLKDNMDVKMKELEYLAFRINNDPKLTPYKMTSEGYSVTEGISQIGFHKSSVGFIEDCFLYFRNDKLFSSIGSFSVETLSRYFYLLDEEKKKQFINEINTLAMPKLIGAESVYLYNSSYTDMLTYLYPISYANGTPYCTLIMLIKKSYYDKMIENLLGDLQGSVVIFDREKNVLVSTSRTFALTGEIIEAIKNNSMQGKKNIKINEENISLISVVSNNTDWTFIAALPSAQFLEKVINLKVLIWQAVLAIFVCGITAVIFIANRNYKPVESAINQNISLQAQINLQRPLIKDQVISRLLKGEVNDETSLQKMLEYAGIKFWGSFYTVVIINKENRNESASFSTYKNSVLMAIDQHYGKEGVVYAVELIQSRAIALVVNLQSDSEQVKEEIAVDIKQNIESSTSENIIMGVGKTYSSISLLNRSFIEAFAALESNLLTGDGKIIFFDDIIKYEQKIYWYPVEEQLRYIQSLKQGDKTVALETLNNMMASISEKSSTVLKIKYVCFDLVNTIIKTLNEINLSGFDSEIAALMEFSSLHDLFGKLKNITERLCNSINDRKKVKDEHLFSQVLDYVNKKYDDVNMSLEVIAEEFNLPLYYLSRFFKDQTNSTFTDYVTGLRMLKAKKLLAETDKHIKDIVFDIGYTDFTYFMKKFKKIEGITPGNYREIHSKITSKVKSVRKTISASETNTHL